ncbi:hypothetical protein NAC44_06740 [Allorhizobium sp. BGMRC 0089]|uniref:hypothetical protein n=1 Tax=Allorhizobium sonneratiae TaxID=2934936 RepID=UPI0020338100|nr:hypothetical protein [Allorhizobium sonneratiae]MCM2292026.1 hypothetical protein [Allorhizobium sonneratiae]
MLFNIEYDQGDRLEGYFIPDGFSEQPVIIVYDRDQPIAEVICDQEKPAVVVSGRHQSGLVGFLLTEERIAGLAAMDSLMIRDKATGILIYQRSRPDAVKDIKLIRLETRLVPFDKLDRYMARHFDYGLASVERYGHETALQAFHLSNVSSIYLSGRLLMRNYEEFLDSGFKAAIHICDPYYEMATRLFILKRLPQLPTGFLGERDRMILSQAADLFQEVDLENSARLNMLIKKATPALRNVLASPMTRQLATNTPEQLTGRMDVAPAIDLLSRFAIVANDAHDFNESLSELTGLGGDDMPVWTQHTPLQALADRLRALPAAEHLIEQDLILYHYVNEAIADSMKSQTGIDAHA